MKLSKQARSSSGSTLWLALWLTACGGGAGSAPVGGGPSVAGGAPCATDSKGGDGGASPCSAHLPLVLVRDVALPGGATRFDYQDIDPARGRLYIAHMNDASVVVADLSDGSVVKVLSNIPTARGVAVAGDIGRVFVTSSPNKLVVIDGATLEVVGRVDTGTGPDGVGWDSVDKTVAVSDQGDGAVSLLRDSGAGARVQIPLGSETGNVIFDAARGRFWVTVVTSAPPDKLVAIDPVAAKVAAEIPLPGCSGAHGLRLHPDGESAFVACEGNDVLARVDLAGGSAVVTAKTGAGPDVLSVDPGLGWIYVAAESGALNVFDIQKPGLTRIDEEHPGDHAHSVLVDPATHRAFFPLQRGPNGVPVLRIMRPSGS